MKWEEVRGKYLNRWVLVEALTASSKNNKRFIQDMAVISDYDNSKDAWKGYKALHLINRSRELYIFHTCNEQLEVIEQKFTRVRRAIL